MNALRPTSSKVRQALFNILFDISGLTFADLFAGTGEVGITALKKGASFVYFIEKDRRRSGKIREKASKFSKNFKVISTDALKFLGSFQGKIDIIFADPPYNYRHYDKLIKTALEKLSDEGVFVLEHRSSRSFNADEERKYGDTLLSFWRKK
ncbi:MAG: RsmD family RNA methyltransferase [Persephonella sp.]|nr:RsmD family RNA methyltransferase [Persephonella sp.]